MQTQQKLFTNRMLLTLLWPLVVEQALKALHENGTYPPSLKG